MWGEFPAPLPTFFTKVGARRSDGVLSGQVCPRGERANQEKVCERCDESPELYDWLYLGFMAMLPLVLHWFFIERFSGKKRSRPAFPPARRRSFQGSVFTEM